MNTDLDITAILNRISGGDKRAVDDLLPLVYEDLHRRARGQMAGERSDHTLQATALVHDAYLRLFPAGVTPGFLSQNHFYAAAANAMRRILIDHARSKARLKRGGDRFQVELSSVCDPDAATGLGPAELLELDDALRKLENMDEQVAEIVRLRLYAGLSVTKAASVIGISRTVAYERWDYAMSWFAVELADS